LKRKEKEIELEIVLTNEERGSIHTEVKLDKIIIHFNEDDYKEIPSEIKQKMIDDILTTAKERMKPIIEIRNSMKRLEKLAKGMNIFILGVAGLMLLICISNFSKGHYGAGIFNIIVMMLDLSVGLNIFPRIKHGKRFGLFGKEQEENESKI
jgi:hypothetical protein